MKACQIAEGLGEPAIARYTAQLLQGLHYLHSHGVAHRDIKGANILVSQYNEVKLADFGASKKIEDLVTVGVCLFPVTLGGESEYAVYESTIHGICNIIHLHW